jgi:hypothetical protein
VDYAITILVGIWSCTTPVVVLIGKVVETKTSQERSFKFKSQTCNQEMLHRIQELLSLTECTYSILYFFIATDAAITATTSLLYQIRFSASGILAVHSSSDGISPLVPVSESAQLEALLLPRQALQGRQADPG